MLFRDVAPHSKRRTAKRHTDAALLCLAFRTKHIDRELQGLSPFEVFIRKLFRNRNPDAELAFFVGIERIDVVRYAWTETPVPPALLPSISSRNTSICHWPLAVRHRLSCQSNAVNGKRDGRSLVHLDLESRTTILFNANVDCVVIHPNAIIAGQTRLGQLQAVLHGAELVALQDVLCQFLTIGIGERYGKLCSCLNPWCFVVTLGVSDAAHINRLPRPIDTAVGVDIDVMLQLVVIVVAITPSQTFLAEGIVCAFRQLDIKVIPVATISYFGNTSLVGCLFLKENILLPFPFIERHLHAALWFACHGISYHQSFLAVG